MAWKAVAFNTLTIQAGKALHVQTFPNLIGEWVYQLPFARVKVLLDSGIRYNRRRWADERILFIDFGEAVLGR